MIQIKNIFTGELILEVANLRDANLSYANLRGANLSGANLRVADLSVADLSDADLSDATLRGADLRGADLSGANLSGANLSGANLRGADLRGADLRGADLRGANLSDARGVIFAQISFAGHGERRRQLSAVKITEQLMFYCGCFKGTEASLREYIENGEEKLKASRIFALETCLKAIEFQPNF